jgi:hypothetical protein
VADHWGLPFTLQVIFCLPALAFLTFLNVPDPVSFSGKKSPEA